MGALFQFDRMLPTIEPEAKGIVNPKRQVEIFTYGGKLFLRMGAVDSENAGDNRYTVQLTKNDAREIISSINNGVEYLNL